MALGKNRESEGFRQPFVCCLSALEWIANQPTFQKHNRHYRTEAKGCALKKMLSVVAHKATVLVMLGFYGHDRAAIISTFSPADACCVVLSDSPSALLTQPPCLWFKPQL